VRHLNTVFPRRVLRGSGANSYLESLTTYPEWRFEQHCGPSATGRPTTPRGRATGLPWHLTQSLCVSRGGGPMPLLPFLAVGLYPPVVSLRAKSVCPLPQDSHE